MEPERRQLTKRGDPMTSFVPRLSKEAAAAQGDLFLLLRNKTRLRIIDLLAQYGGLIYVGKIAEILGEHAPAISDHLGKLRHAGLVSREKKGTYAYYSLNVGALEAYQQFLAQYSLPQGASM